MSEIRTTGQQDEFNRLVSPRDNAWSIRLSMEVNTAWLGHGAISPGKIGKIDADVELEEEEEEDNGVYDRDESREQHDEQEFGDDIDFFESPSNLGLVLFESDDNDDDNNSNDESNDGTDSQGYTARERAELAQSEATTLLDLLNSPFNFDSIEGRELLNWLNSPDRSQLARRLLNFSDEQHRSNLLNIAGDDDRIAALPRILDLRESNNRRDNRAYADLQYYLESGDPTERYIGRSLVLLMVSNDTVGLAVEILKQFESPTLAREMLNLISQSTPQSVQAIRSLITGSSEDRNRLHRLIELRTGPINNFNEIKKITAPQAGPIPGAQDERPIANRLLAMLTTDNPQQRTIAQTLIDRVPNLSHTSHLLNLLTSDRHRAGANEVISMLRSTDYRQVQGANILLQFLVAESLPVGNRAGLQELKGQGRQNVPLDGNQALELIERLSDAQQREATRQLLRAVESTSELTTILRMPAEERVQTISMLNNRELSNSMRRIINNLPSSAVSTMRTMLANPAQRSLAERLLRLDNSSDAVTEFLDKIAQPAQRQLEQMLITQTVVTKQR